MGWDNTVHLFLGYNKNKSEVVEVNEYDDVLKIKKYLSS